MPISYCWPLSGLPDLPIARDVIMTLAKNIQLVDDMAIFHPTKETAKSKILSSKIEVPSNIILPMDYAPSLEVQILFVRKTDAKWSEQ